MLGEPESQFSLAHSWPTAGGTGKQFWIMGGARRLFGSACLCLVFGVGLGLAEQTNTGAISDPNVRIVKGKPHRITERLWQTLKAKPRKEESGLLIAWHVVKEEIPPDERIRNIVDYNQQLVLQRRSLSSPPLQQPTREVYGGLIALTNYPAALAVGSQEFVVKAVKVGSVKTSLGRMKLFDFGVAQDVAKASGK